MLFRSYKGTSDSPLLLELVIQFYQIQFKYSFTCIVTHAAGTRLIAQGSDGLSRGATNEGIMNGADFMSFIPLHLNPLQRSPSLIYWIRSWTKASTLEILKPIDWFLREHDIDEVTINPITSSWSIKTSPGTFLWYLPPGAAHVALEGLRKAVIKRNNSTHIIIVPRLLLPFWRKIGRAHV